MENIKKRQIFFKMLKKEFMLFRLVFTFLCSYEKDFV